MNYNIIAILVIAFCFIVLVAYKAYALLVGTVLLMGFYSIVVQSGKFPKLQQFVDDAL